MTTPPINNSGTPSNISPSHFSTRNGAPINTGSFPIWTFDAPLPPAKVGDFMRPEPDAGLDQYNFFDETLLSEFPLQSSPTCLTGELTQVWRSGGFNKDISTTTTTEESFHGRTDVNSGVRCDDCGADFDKQVALARHAKQTQHAAYICRCGERCSRLDVLERHIQTFQPTTTHPCPYCNKFRGSKAFTRRDHLLQHWRGHHNIELISDSGDPHSAMGTRPRMRKSLSCPHGDCPYFRSQNSLLRHPFQDTDAAFRTQSQLTKHLREVHSESPFECTEPYCSRTGGRGFFRKADLSRHQREHHSPSSGA